ncbi:MAG: hypothetical protein ACKO2Z_37605 [Sphaerospermopsis kisseleviana]
MYKLFDIPPDYLGFSIVVIEVWTISNSKVYILTYRAEEKHYDSFLKDIEQTMIRSFRFQPHVTL